MKKIKKYALWILGGLVVILGIILGLSYEREKIQKLKREAKRTKADKQIAVAQALREVALQEEKKLAKKDEAIDQRVKDIEEQIAEVQESTKEMTTDEMANEFNTLYGSGK
jgi:uncharacterized protein YlxW (UPF0749 family)